jgi:adenine-specific DNA methylase
MTFNSEYIEKNLIAYIGNKRRLLPLIINSIEKTGVLDRKKSKVKFLDLFAGTGVISRLSKNLGFETHTNDWEYYSYIMNSAFVGLEADFLKNSFSNLGGLKKTIDKLNSLKCPGKDDEYISKFYCPEDDENPDMNNERLFYTSYNGKKIDAIRSKIEEWASCGIINKDEEIFLLALLIYEASTRSNTSGVFKGFHRGFGGTNGDALTRIMKQIKLEMPVLINGKKSFIYNENAVELSRELSSTKFDIVYLDPPYNQHQYGSNYHLLNTIAYNDKPDINKKVMINGKKTNKSAIRRDWIKTKSGFCYKHSAVREFSEIIKNINTDYILISYSTDGIIPFDEMLGILSAKGKVDIVTSEYVKFRGGKQSLTNEMRNIEFVLMVNTTKKPDFSDIDRIQSMLSQNRISLLMKKTINPILAESIGFEYRSKISKKNLNIEKILFKIYDNVPVEYHINRNRIVNNLENTEKIMQLPHKILESVLCDLEYITDMTKEDEIYLSINEINRHFSKEDYDEAFEVFTFIPYLLSKFNNKKAYNQCLKAIIEVLKTMNQTSELWKSKDVLNSKSFQKLEKIIMLKLNYQSENEELVANDKKKISLLYDILMDDLENKKTAVKAGKKKIKVAI